jgi:8-oxo-dGTP pyrophosphatase MutT (NUDIX family)
MKINDTMHPAQVAILHALLFRPSAGFAELQKASALSSDHFAFHLKKMIEQKLINKNSDGKYTLTIPGKEYANRFDTDARVVERQPKVAALLTVENRKGEWLCQQRLKQPYYGFWGRPTGKIRYGETILEGAARELMEETNLTATLEFKGIYHKLDYTSGEGKLLEDKIFFIIHGTDPQGTLAEEFEGGRNKWLSIADIQKLESAFEGLDKNVELVRGPMSFVERRHEYDPKVY